jgi:hypothetical protein
MEKIGETITIDDLKIKDSDIKKIKEKNINTADANTQNTI